VEWLQGFRTIFLGGGPVWPELLEEAVSRQLPLSLGYGMTETAAMVTALTPADFLLGARSSGPALPHATVRIGSDGAVIVGGDSLFRGYHPAWRERVEFTTGDLGRLDDRQHLQVLGRRDAAVITGGEKVDPAEVEAVLRGSGELPDVVVVGVPDAEWGQVVVAAYPAGTKPDLAKVGEVLRRNLPAYKHPKRFAPLAVWPVNELGKINRAEVRRLAQVRPEEGDGEPAR
jgi:O-succinylbenzoic acid--CoA ligase